MMSTSLVFDHQGNVLVRGTRRLSVQSLVVLITGDDLVASHLCPGARAITLRRYRFACLQPHEYLKPGNDCH